MALQGNRIVTSLVYLSDVEAGGQTIFSNLDFTVEPQQGRVRITLKRNEMREVAQMQLLFGAGSGVSQLHSSFSIES